MTDSDGYARLLRLSQFWHEGGWYDPVLRRLSAPDGVEMHWGRALDVLLLPLMAAGSLVTTPDRALFAIGLVFSPLLHAATAALLVAGAWSILPRAGVLAIPLLMMAGRTLLMDSAAGRPDHHALLALAGALGFVAVLRECPRWLSLAGVVAGFTLWATPEALLVILATALPLGLLWLKHGAPYRSLLARFAVSAALTASAALVLERPFGQWGAVEIDRLSVLHLAALWALALLALALRPVEHRNRLWFGAGGAMVALALLLAAFPQVLSGGYGQVAPVARRLILDVVPAERPLLPGNPRQTFDFLIDLGPALVAAASTLWGLARRQGARFVLYGATLALFLPLGMAIARFALYAELAALLPLAELLGRALARGRGIALAALAAIAAPLAGAAAIHATYFPNLGFAVTRPCTYGDLAGHLAVTGRALSGTVLTELYDAPEIAWKLGAGTVSAPYHRDTAGLEGWERLVWAHADAPETTALLDRYRVEAVLFCRGRARSWGPELRLRPDSVVTRALTGRGAAWMAPEPLPPELARRYVLYRVIR